MRAALLLPLLPPMATCGPRQTGPAMPSLVAGTPYADAATIEIRRSSDGEW